MAWQQLTFSTTAELAEQVNEFLLATDALAVTLQDAEDAPIFEPPLGTTPLWGKTQVIALFDEHLNIKLLLEQLAQTFGELPPYTVLHLEDKNWERVWMDEFKPMQFGKGLWICPSWCEPVDPAAANLLLDPGLAFGTGSHPTTRLCLEWLAAHPPLGQQVIDYGCGSGVLAIAALKLGAQTAYAIDNDPQALIATHENAMRNQITTERIKTLAPECMTRVKVDLLLANILAQPLIELAEKFASLIKPKGTVILSGLLHNQVAHVEQAYQPWFTLQEITQLDDWVRICLQADSIE